ncbi:MAG TPA: hypothetical protein VKR53_15580, partial [Puia sp.]|nr:hypothetical protein [Puia sp.]
MSYGKPKIKKPFYKRIIKILLIVVCAFFALIIAIGLLIQTSPVQNYIKSEAVSYLKSKLHTNVSVGKIYITFPKNVVINEIYLEDQKKDTLFSAGKLSVNISMFKLLHGNIEINTFNLENSTIKVKRLLPDTVFNFQFIVDAFTSAPKNDSKSKDSSPSQISVHAIRLDRIDIVYNDVVSGNDDSIFLNHFAVNIDKFDLAHQSFSVPSMVLSTVRGSIDQRAPLVNTETKKADHHQDGFPSFELNAISFSDIQLNYYDKQSALGAEVNLNNLAIRVKNLDMLNKKIILDKMELAKTDIALELGKILRSSKKAPDDKQAKSADSTSWRVSVKQFKLDDDRIVFDNNNDPRKKMGMDYSHIKLENLILHADNLVYSDDTIAAEITKGTLKEQNHFELIQLAGKFLFSNKQAFVKNIYLRTNGSLLRGNAILNYPSLDIAKKNPSSLLLNVDMPDSKLQVKDILTFVPDLNSQTAFRNPAMILRFSTKMTGNLANLNIYQLKCAGFENSQIDLHGLIKGLPESKNIFADLVMANISTSKKDLAIIFPPNTIPSNFTVPDRLSLKGNIKGSMDDLSTDLAFVSSSGSVTVKGSAKNIRDVKNIIYKATVSTEKLNLGQILRDEKDWG